jgi:hypothetical protein
MTLHEYRELLRTHDWFFNYADDHRAWSKGNDERKVLNNAYDQLSAEGFEVEARELFNAMSPDEFHMKEPK